jgi:hypothetical protein
MLEAKSRKFAEATVSNGTVTFGDMNITRQSSHKVGVARHKDPKQNVPFRFDALEDGFHEVHFHDHETKEALTLIFARMKNARHVAVAVLGFDVPDAQTQLHSLVTSDSGPSGEDLMLDVYPAWSASAKKAILDFTGGHDTAAQIAALNL